MKSVSVCETTRPPTTARPSGCRASAPAPRPSAIGSVPTSAAIVVIMIGRNRTRQASYIASAGDLPSLALRFDREVDHHDAVLLHEADQHDDADEGVEVEVDVEDQQRDERAETRRRQSRQNRQRVNEALVQDAEHDVDDEDRHQRG